MRTGRPPVDLDADPLLFWDRVAIGDGCWEWQAGRFPSGYGCVKYRKRSRPAHRVAWSLWHGSEPPDELYVCHHCDNKPCVRPDHLYLGTNQRNQLDAVERGQHYSWNQGWTHCQKGHSYGDAYRWRDRRYCRQCAIASQKAFRERKAT